MNERIKELELQCWEPTQYGPAWFNSTKFAELIVGKCIAQCEQFLDDPDFTIGAMRCAIQLNQYFGIE